MFPGAIRDHCCQMDSHIYRQKVELIKPSQRNIQSCLYLWRNTWLSHSRHQIRSWVCSASLCFASLRYCQSEKEKANATVSSQYLSPVPSASALRDNTKNLLPRKLKICCKLSYHLGVHTHLLNNAFNNIE